MIDHLERTFGLNAGISFVYFDYKDPETQSCVEIAANMLKQLLSRLPDIPDNLANLLDDIRSDARHSIDISKITKTIGEVVHNFSSIFLLIDALDECESFTARRDLLRLLKLLRGPNIRIFITCRPHIQPLEEAHTVDIRAHREDLDTYVRAKLENANITRELREEIVDKLLKSAHGTYLLSKGELIPGSY